MLPYVSMTNPVFGGKTWKGPIDAFAGIYRTRLGLDACTGASEKARRVTDVGNKSVRELEG